MFRLLFLPTGGKNEPAEDVRFFQFQLADNLMLLYEKLQNKTYEHGEYEAFKVNDPKPRDIHKARVVDRVVHHLIYSRRKQDDKYKRFESDV